MGDFYGGWGNGGNIIYEDIRDRGMHRICHGLPLLNFTIGYACLYLIATFEYPGRSST